MLLPWLILIPFIGGFLCWQTERFGVKMPRWIALITMGLTLALGLQLWLQGGYSLTQSAGIPQWQSEFILPWIPRFGITIHLAIDGLSLLMVVLTGLLGVLAVLCSWREIEKYQGFFHLNLMWILERQHPALTVIEPICGLPGAIHIDIGQHHLITLLQQMSGNGVAQTGGGAGH